MAPKYKLTYFDLTGLGESIRFLLSYGDLEFEDNRISRDTWPTLKPTIKPPVGQLPLLEVDGKVLFQSTAIARYLGNVIGIAGANPLENWEIDSVVDTIIDLRTKIFAWFTEQNESKKQELQKTLVTETFPFFLSKFEAWAKQNSGYLAIGKLTWADIVFVANIDFLDEFCSKIFDKPSILSGYPTLEALKDTIFSLPNIKAWVDKRPPSNF
nr:GSTs4 [Pagiophloeus tsushimanus]